MAVISVHVSSGRSGEGLAARGEQVIAGPDGVEALRIGELRFAEDGVSAAIGVKLQTKLHRAAGYREFSIAETASDRALG